MSPKAATIWQVLVVLVGIAAPLGCVTDAKAQVVTGILEAGTVAVGLDKAEGAANRVLDNATGSASALERQAAQSALVLIQAMRQELHEELNTQVSALRGERATIFQQLSQTIYRATAGVGEQALKLEDRSAIDIDNIVGVALSTTTPYIRKIVGTAIIKQPTGFYNISVMSNAFLNDGRKFSVKLDQKALPTEKVRFAPPYDLSIGIPVEMLNPLFVADKVTPIRLHINGEIPDLRHWWFKFWEPSTRQINFDIPIDLFPIESFEYRLVVHSTVNVNEQKDVLYQEWAVPGCGNDGCWVNHRFCIPSQGAAWTGERWFTDTLGGAWGTWEPEGNPQVDFDPTQACATFQQHRPAARTVGMRLGILRPVAHDKVDIFYLFLPDATQGVGQKSGSTIHAGQLYESTFPLNTTLWELEITSRLSGRKVRLSTHSTAPEAVAELTPSGDRQLFRLLPVDPF